MNWPGTELWTLKSYPLERVRMPNPVHCSVCDHHWIVKCSKCKARGYLLRNWTETISGGEDIVVCARCNGTGVEPGPACGRPFLSNE